MSEATTPAEPGQSPATPNESAKPQSDNPEMVTLTVEQLNAKLSAAADGERQKLIADAKKKQDADEAEAARKRGEFEMIANQEKARADAAEASLAAMKREQTIRDAVAKAGKDKSLDVDKLQTYVGNPLLATLKADAAPEDVTKAVKAAVDQYAKDHPPAAKPRTFDVVGGRAMNGDDAATAGKPNPFLNRLSNI